MIETETTIDEVILRWPPTAAPKQIPKTRFVEPCGNSIFKTSFEICIQKWKSKPKWLKKKKKNKKVMVGTSRHQTSTTSVGYVTCCCFYWHQLHPEICSAPCLCEHAHCFAHGATATRAPRHATPHAACACMLRVTIRSFRSISRWYAFRCWHSIWGIVCAWRRCDFQQ